MASHGGPDPTRPAPASSQSPPPCSSSDSSLPTLWSPRVVHTRRTSVGVANRHRPPSDPAPSPVPALRGPATAPQSALRSSLLQLPGSGLTPRPGHAPASPPSRQVSLSMPSPGLRPPPPLSEDAVPDVECSICFSQFNNIFRCPKMLQCKHTFCLECLARINVKSSEPSAIQCPLCRGLTPLPALGLPRLATDSDVLSCLPAAMQRVYSVRFVRSKGKLQVKRSAEARWQWGQRSLACLRPNRRSLNVGLPSPPVVSPGEASGVGRALFRLTGRPVCRAFLLTSMVMMMVLLTGIIIFLLTFNREVMLP